MADQLASNRFHDDCRSGALDSKKACFKKFYELRKVLLESMISKRRGGTVWIPIQINEQSAEPLYHQIEVQLRANIVSGQMAEGTAAVNS